MAAVPALRVGRARGVEGHRVAQRGEHAVVHEALAHRHVAQAGRAEVAAPRLGVGPATVPGGAAQADVVGVGARVGRQRAVARHAQRLVAEVGEQGARRVVRGRAHAVAGRAVAAVGVAEDRQAALLARAQGGPAAQRVVEARVERRQRVAAQVGLQAVAEGVERAARIAQHAGAVAGLERGFVARLAQPPHRRARGAQVHLVAREQRLARLRGQGVGTAVEHQAAEGRGRLGVVVLIEIERRQVARVGQRGRVARAQAGAHAAAGHAVAPAVEAGEAPGGIVAARAAGAARARQAGVLEQPAAQRDVLRRGRRQGPRGRDDGRVARRVAHVADHARRVARGGGVRHGQGGEQRGQPGRRPGDRGGARHGARKPVLSQAIFEPVGTQVVSSLPSRV